MVEQKQTSAELALQSGGALDRQDDGDRRVCLGGVGERELLLVGRHADTAVTWKQELSKLGIWHDILR